MSVLLHSHTDSTLYCYSPSRGNSCWPVLALPLLLRLSEQSQQPAQANQRPATAQYRDVMRVSGLRCQQGQALTTTTEARRRSSCGKITWHQNSRFKLREENKSPSTYSRVVLENLIRCTAAEMCYLTVATYINKSVT